MGGKGGRPVLLYTIEAHTYVAAPYSLRYMHNESFQAQASDTQPPHLPLATSFGADPLQTRFPIAQCNVNLTPSLLLNSAAF